MNHSYRVLRAMQGDRNYAEGDTRELTPAEAKHLVDLGVLKDLGPVKEGKASADEAAPDSEGKKQAPAPANKQAPEPANKAVRAAKGK